VTAAPALAAATVSSSGVYEDFASNLCNLKICTATFSAVPLAKTLIITQLACRLQTVGGVFDAYLTSPGTDHKVYFTPTLSMQVPNRNIYMINADATHIATMLTQPSVKVTTLPAGKVVEVSCSISGKLE